MQKTSYTPGPWKYCPDGWFNPDVQTMGGGLIADVRAGWPLENQKENRERISANARLIAAAPEMLEALESIKNHALNYKYKKDGNSNDARVMAILSLAGLAISKSLAE